MADPWPEVRTSFVADSDTEHWRALGAYLSAACSDLAVAFIVDRELRHNPRRTRTHATTHRLRHERIA